MEYYIQKHIRDQVAKLSREQIIQQLAFLDTLLEGDDDTIFQLIGCTRNQAKSLKSKLISQLKK